MKYKNENLEQLLNQFVDQSRSQSMAEDIRQADRLMDRYPVGSVRPQTIEQIKQSVRHERLKHRRLYSEIKWISSVAAIVFIVLFAGLYAVFSGNENKTVVPEGGFAQAVAFKGYWSDIPYEDSVVIEIDQELTNVAEMLDTVEMETFEPVHTIQVELIEMELDEIESLTENTEFWKG